MLNSLTDEAILLEMGQHITQRRLALQYTQAKVAEQAGVGKRTLERIEAGGSAQTLTLIRILRVLGLLSRMNDLFPASEPSPMDLLKHKGKKRRRASTRRPADQLDKPWTWDDET